MAGNPWVPIPVRVRYAIIVIVVLGSLACSIAALSMPEANGSTPLLALASFVSTMVTIAPLIFYKEDQFGWFHPLILPMLYFLALKLPRRAMLYIYGLNEHAVLPLTPDELTGLVAYETFLMILASLATYAGFFAVKNPRIPKLRFRAPKHMPMMVAASAALGGVALLGLVYVTGSFSQLFLNLSLNREAKVFASDDVSIYGQIAVLAGILATALTVVLAYRPDSLRKMTFWIMAAAALVLVYLASGKRSATLTPILTAMLVWMLATGRVPILRLFLLGCALFVGLCMLTVVRSASMNAGSVEEFWSRADFDVSDAASNQAEEFATRAGSYNSAYPIFHYVPHESPLLWGETYFTILLRPIPRSLMPNKPHGTDYRAGAEFFNAVWGIPPGPIAEAYWNFHIPGVIGVFFLTGIFYRWLGNFYLRYRAHGIVTFFYVSLVVGFSPTENVITGLMQGLLLMAIMAVGSGALRLGTGSD